METSTSNPTLITPKISYTFICWKRGQHIAELGNVSLLPKWGHKSDGTLAQLSWSDSEWLLYWPAHSKQRDGLMDLGEGSGLVVPNEEGNA